jgi:hypothetical protein
MKKISTAVARQTKNSRDHKLTIGLDLGHADGERADRGAGRDRIPRSAV